MASFFSEATGKNMEYRGWLSDNIRIVFLAHANSPGDLRARLAGQSGDYQLVSHTAVQVKNVMVDMDAADVQMHTAAKTATIEHESDEEAAAEDQRPHRGRRKRG
jgi:hypothetical protein